MRPFLPISLPPVPPYPEFEALVSALSETPLSLLDSADQALKTARKEWEAVSKASPETGRFVGSEKAWRAGARDVIRACIAGSIAVGAVRKAVGADGKMSGDVKVEVPTVAKAYHAWWVVPKISVAN